MSARRPRPHSLRRTWGLLGRLCFGADTRFYELVVAISLAVRAGQSLAGARFWPYSAWGTYVPISLAAAVAGVAVLLLLYGLLRAESDEVSGRPACRGWACRAWGLIVAALCYAAVSVGASWTGPPQSGAVQAVAALMCAFTAGRHITRRGLVKGAEDTPCAHPPKEVV